MRGRMPAKSRRPFARTLQDTVAPSILSHGDEPAPARQRQSVACGAALRAVARRAMGAVCPGLRSRPGREPGPWVRAGSRRGGRRAILRVAPPRGSGAGGRVRRRARARLESLRPRASSGALSRGRGNRSDGRRPRAGRLAVRRTLRVARTRGRSPVAAPLLPRTQQPGDVAPGRALAAPCGRPARRATPRAAVRGRGRRAGGRAGSRPGASAFRVRDAARPDGRHGRARAARSPSCELLLHPGDVPCRDRPDAGRARGHGVTAPDPRAARVARVRRTTAEGRPRPGGTVPGRVPAVRVGRLGIARPSGNRGRRARPQECRPGSF